MTSFISVKVGLGACIVAHSIRIKEAILELTVPKGEVALSPALTTHWKLLDQKRLN